MMYLTKGIHLLMMIFCCSSDYVHRVGRTARAGRSGDAVTFVTQYDLELFSAIESLLKRKIEELKIKEDKVLDGLHKISEAKRVARLKIEEKSMDLKENLKKTRQKEELEQQKRKQRKNNDK